MEGSSDRMSFFRDLRPEMFDSLVIGVLNVNHASSLLMDCSAFKKVSVCLQIPSPVYVKNDE